MFIQCLLFLTIFGSLHADYFRMSLRPKPCVIPRLEHGRVRVRRTTLIKFVCLQRYELVGNRYATCRDGQWDTPTPVCVRSGCTVPNIENGIVAASRNNAWVMYFCLPGFSLVGSSAIYCDGRRWNSTAPTCVNSTIKHALTCDFENGLCGWSQDELHDFDWWRINTKTPSAFMLTGPSYDHTYGPGGNGYYMYIESTSRLENDTARLLSPVYDKSLANDGCFSFFYHMYGRTCGGLRVYQKPDKLPLEALLQSSDDVKKEYMLFEKWGNLGDFWFSSVSSLRQYDDDFQIIIEGIRGPNFASDIAIDDVAILQGEKCTVAKNAATTPSPNPFMSDSCVGRCRATPAEDAGQGCGCSNSCLLLHGNCCPDFFDVCVFVSDTTVPEDMLPANSSDDDIAPHTQKLVATTPETTSSSTTTSTTTTTTTTTTTERPTTTSTTTTTTTTTPRPTTSTTQRPTTTSTTTTTTTKPTPTTTTTIKTTPTTTTQTTKATPCTTTTIKFTYAPPPHVVHTTRLQTTTVKTTFATKTTTSMPYGISRTIENHNQYHDLIEKRRKENTVETRKLTHHVKGAEQKSSSGWAIALIVLGVVLVVGAVIAARLRGSVRARMSLANLRGRVTNDPEVRYLSADYDDV